MYISKGPDTEHMHSIFKMLIFQRDRGIAPHVESCRYILSLPHWQLSRALIRADAPEVRCIVGLVAVVTLSACSFATSLSQGRRAVHRHHAWIDAGLSIVPFVGCGLAAIAWVEPDMYAPVQGDASSWNSAGERSEVRDLGATWTPISCVVGAILLASTIYGQVVAPKGPDSDLPYLQGAAEFVRGFQAAGQQPRSQTQQPSQPQTQPVEIEGLRTRQSCTSDFSCGMGSQCVKPRYQSTGFCAKSVDSTGTRTFEAPDPDSIGPNLGDSSDCEIDGCPAGFRCDARSGVCLR